MSETEINFLDTTVFKVDNKLRTKVYVKPTDRQIYLHSKSEHPNSTAKCIAYRFNKICYNRSNFHDNCKRLLSTLTKRGYNKTDSGLQPFGGLVCDGRVLKAHICHMQVNPGVHKMSLLMSRGTTDNS